MGIRDIRISKLNQARKYSAAHMAKAIGVSRQTYAKLEEHPERMTLEQARRASELLGCSTDELFYLPRDVN